MFGKKVTTVVTIEGMRCQHCAHHVAEALYELPGVRRVIVNLEAKQATIFSKSALDETDVQTVIKDAGFTVKGIR